MANKFVMKNWNVSAYEYDTNCPLNLLNCRVIPGRLWKDPAVYQDLMEVSREYDLVLPFQDKAVQVLSDIKSKQKDTKSICVSPIQTASACLNKQEFENIFLDEDFYPRPIIGSPAIVKPVHGYGSRGISYLKQWNGESYDGNIVQKFIDGIELSIDCYFDRNFELIDFVPRQRLEVSSGEVVKSCTVSKSSYQLDSVIRKVSKKLKFAGPICMQFIVDQQSNVWIMEINARFGGGCTLSVAAGLDMIDLLKTEYVDMSNVKNYKSVWTPNLYLSRCYVDYYYEKNSV